MNYTEDEASEKVCPMQEHGDGRWSMCKGSNCMKWEWVDYKIVGERKDVTVKLGKCGL